MDFIHVALFPFFHPPFHLAFTFSSVHAEAHANPAHRLPRSLTTVGGAEGIKPLREMSGLSSCACARIILVASPAGK